MIVPPLGLAAVLGGAALHAAWNVGIRGGADRRAATAALLLAAGAIGLLALPFFPTPARAAWPHLVLSAFLHILYFNLVAETYRLGSVSLTYPTMRGSAPALTAVIAALFFGERLGLAGWGGLILISAGVLLLARARNAGSERRALALALLNAVVIALYTVNDGLGVRVSQAPFAYGLWTFILPALPAALILTRGRLLSLFKAQTLRETWVRGFGGGFCSLAAYTLALWAMTVAPIGAVAALRETSMLFALLLAALFLAERPGRRGLIAALAIALGAAVLGGA